MMEINVPDICSAASKIKLTNLAAYFAYSENLPQKSRLPFILRLSRPAQSHRLVVITSPLREPAHTCCGIISPMMGVPAPPSYPEFLLNDLCYLRLNIALAAELSAKPEQIAAVGLL